MSAVYSNLGDGANLVRPTRLLDRMRQVLWIKHYAYSTEQAYVQWDRRYLLLCVTIQLFEVKDFD